MIVNNLQLYQRSKSFIWTDKHISKNMLAAHLDLDSDEMQIMGSGLNI